MTGRVRRSLPPAGLEQVLAAGRRRRRRAKVTGLALLSALAVTIGGVVTQAGNGGTVGIDMADQDTRQQRDPDLTPTAPARRKQPTTAGPTATASPRGQDPSNDITPSPSPSRRPAPGSSGEPVMWGPERTDDFSNCPDILLGAYCTRVRGPEEMDQGTPEAFTFWLCRHQGLLPETVNFATRQEVEFFIARLDDMKRVWTWSRSFEFPAAWHSMTVEGGYCYVWTMEWDGVDAEGRPLPPGEYLVEGRTWAEEWKAKKADGPSVASWRVFIER